MNHIVFLLLILSAGYVTIEGFNFVTRSGVRVVRRNGRKLSMEYIPDGLTKAQWEEIKRKEAEEEKKRNYGAMGVTKFKSRAFEAWQKSGSGHLFPVSSDTPLEARPYMQRVGGSADGEDLKKRGINPKGQATPSAKNDADIKYEQLEKEGKLWGFNLPWTSEATNSLSKSKNNSKGSGKTEGKVNPKLPTNSRRSDSTPSITSEEPPKKKGFFGLF